MAVVAPQGQQNDTNNQNEQPGQPQTLAGSTQSGQPSSGRIASFSSGQPQNQGSGRFTNLSKYMDANKGASENLGARAGGQLNREFDKGQNQVSTQNQKIAEGFQAGRTNLNQGQGYQTQLNDIGQGLNSFQSLDNRGTFDTAGQQAQNLAKDNNYTTLASGSAFDQNAMQAQQTAAQGGAQNLLNTNQQNLQNLQTNQGRDQLLNTVIPKQGYSAGQRSFDKLFLTGDVLSGLNTNLQGKQTTAQGLLKNTSAQQGTLDTLTNDEANIVAGLTGQAKTNQDLFNTKFGNQQNITDVNTARNARFNELKSALSSGGAISQEDMQLLGLDQLNNTFVNENTTGGGKVGTYNLLKDPSAVNKYITQGANANSVQDITTQGDFDTYKALQNLALGRDTGMLSGTSTLGSSINRVGDLAGDISKADQTFRDTYGNKTYLSGSNLSGREHINDIEQYGTGSAPGEYGQSVYGQPSFVQERTAPVDLNAELTTQNQNYNTYMDDYVRPYNTNSSGTPYELDRASALSQSNLGDYLKNGNIGNTQSSEQLEMIKAYNGGVAPDVNSDIRLQDNYLENVARSTSRAGLTTRLEDILNTEGTRNALTTGADKNYRRFRGLV